MSNKTIKYGSLIFIGLLAIYQYIPLGDYCSGLANVFYLLFLVVVFFITFIVYSTFDLFQLIRYHKRFDFIPFLILVVFFSFNYFTFNSEDKKFWTHRLLVAEIDPEELREQRLILYNNNSFAATIFSVDHGCTYQGHYEFREGVLKLKRKDISILTDSAFTTDYKVNLNDSLLIPLISNFDTIVIFEFPADTSFFNSKL